MPLLHRDKSRYDRPVAQLGFPLVVDFNVPCCSFQQRGAGNDHHRHDWQDPAAIRARISISNSNIALRMLHSADPVEQDNVSALQCAFH